MSEPTYKGMQLEQNKLCTPTTCERTLNFGWCWIQLAQIMMLNAHVSNFRIFVFVERLALIEALSANEGSPQICQYLCILLANLSPRTQDDLVRQLQPKSLDVIHEMEEEPESEAGGQKHKTRKRAVTKQRPQQQEDWKKRNREQQ